MIALIGRPNVGKSTLMNRILGQKLSITSRRPQTTRHRILGIKTDDGAQMIYVDTPGLHRHAKKAINRFLNKAASDALYDVDVVVMLVDAGRWTDEDQLVLDKFEHLKVPVIVAINKIDRMKDKSDLLPYLKKLTTRYEFAHILPISAITGEHVDALEGLLRDMIPVAPPLFDEDQITDRSVRFLASEFIREKLFRRLGQELPYGLTVEIEKFEEQEKITRIHGLIWVERDSQKAIVIGKSGSVLKQVGRDARKDLERQLEKKVFLQLWVKVKEGWADDERALRSLGYDWDAYVDK
ncbi:MAG: GTPase Era [Gammaproteobacteria bacterium]|nr:GTPase Era [Gammaproteobacteria bacterium]